MTAAERVLRDAAAECRRVPSQITHDGDVALALATVLDTAADAMEHGDLCFDCPTCLTVEGLLPVARLVLAE